jgi:hypothetical protein
MSETFTFAGKEYDDSLQGAAEVQFDLMNIFDTDPYMFMHSVAYGSGIAYGGFRWVALVTGEAMPGFWTRVIARGHMTAQTIRAVGGLALRAAPYVPFGVVAGHSVYGMENPEKSIPGLILSPAIDYALRDLGRNDSRGGQESGLFYNP